MGFGNSMLDRLDARQARISSPLPVGVTHVSGLKRHPCPGLHSPGLHSPGLHTSLSRFESVDHRALKLRL